MHRSSSRRTGLAVLSVVALGTAGLAALPGTAHAAPAVDVTTVRVQAGSTVTDSGLYDGVFKSGVATSFEAAYPQYKLQFFSVPTATAIAKGESGDADVVLTHSPAQEAQFVSAGYSYESGGRLVMTSDFVTVGTSSDPAGVAAGVQHDTVAAFKEIAAAGDAGKADFLSRNDGSGTNTKELSIWKLTGIPLNSNGEPGTPGTTQTDAWYQVTGQNQGQNLQSTDQCKYPAGACYTLVDRGTYNTLTSGGVVTRLKVVSEQNTAPTEQGGTDLLANPYHAYAVNPAKESSVNIAGALAFLNYLTNAATQKAIANFPNASTPAFVPDAYPDVTVSSFPTSYVAGTPLTLSGTVTPNYPLDPAITGATVDVVRTADPSTTLVATQVAADGTWKAAFRPTVSGPYEVVVPQSQDHLVGTTSFRQPTSLSVGTLTARGATTLSLATRQRVFTLKAHRAVVPVFGSALPQLGRKKAGIRIQIRQGSGAWLTASPSIALRADTARYSTKVSLPKTGTWQIRSVYADPTVVSTAYSRTFYVHVV